MVAAAAQEFGVKIDVFHTSTHPWKNVDQRERATNKILAAHYFLATQVGSKHDPYLIVRWTAPSTT